MSRLIREPRGRVRPMPTSAPKSFRKPVTSRTATNHGTPSRASSTSDGDTVDRAPKVVPVAQTKLGNA